MNGLGIDEKLKRKIEETIKTIMEIDISKFEKTRKLNTISEWDSFNNLMLISKFQEDLKVEFTSMEIDQTQTIRDIFELIERKVREKSGM